MFYCDLGPCQSGKHNRALYTGFTCGRICRADQSVVALGDKPHESRESCRES